MVLKEERKGLDKKFFELCQSVVPTTGLELYDVEYLPGSSELRVYIRNPETQTALIEDCIAVDRALTSFLEEEWVPEKLTLEVSSPGLFRSLRTHQHFVEVIGQTISLTLKEKIGAEAYPALPKSVYMDKKPSVLVTAVTEQGIEATVAQTQVFIEFENIKKANLETSLNHNEH